MTKPIVWTIAGSDSGGGAGVQADLKTFHSLQVYGCSVITALTAQNSVKVSDIAVTSVALLQAQLNVLQEDLPATVIKLGMMGNIENMRCIAAFLSNYHGYVVCDPVMLSTSGAVLLEGKAIEYYIEEIFPHVSLITPNLLEAELLLNRKITTTSDIEMAAQQLRALGARSVLIKGGHAKGKDCHDYFCDADNSFYISTPRIAHSNSHGGGCTLASAISAFLSLDYDMSDSLVLAKQYVQQGLQLAEQVGKGPGPIEQFPLKPCPETFPHISKQQPLSYQFLPCDKSRLKFYPIVDSIEALQQALQAGVKTIQLRVKDFDVNALEKIVEQSIVLAKHYVADLWINDYWQLAIKYQAYGVHLGQDDMQQADFSAIHQAGLRLGLSTHSYTELAAAQYYQPSYIAFGPIFETTSKIMKFSAQGLEKLKIWRDLVKQPLVAIGGIQQADIKTLLDCGADSIAVISAVNHDNNIKKNCETLLVCCDE